ncbi:MAG: class I SAM-dependent methyltransferase [Planctomycetaceae bacterium]
MATDDRIRWDAKYAEKAVPQTPAPDFWLQAQVAHLPPGRALELACGLAHNAIWLTQQGWRVDAVDVSPVGLELAARLARCQHADVRWICADLDEFTPEPFAYDLVLVFRFLDRDRLPAIVSGALRPGGRLIYESFTVAQLQRPDTHLHNPAFALKPGELQQMFPTLTVVSYAECELPDRSVARLVAQA